MLFINFSISMLLGKLEAEYKRQIISEKTLILFHYEHKLLPWSLKSV